MLVTYIGPHKAVELETEVTPPGALPVLKVCKQGESIEVAAAIANGDPKAGIGGLLEQADNWKPAEKKTPKSGG